MASGQKTFSKIAIANRGEVAVRIIRACRELGIHTALLHSEADAGSLAYRMADERVCIGPASSAESYLSIERNILGAVSCGADAIHPGFGFLSENADFAQACLEKQIQFIGPSPKAIRTMGDKISASQLIEREGFPVVPGYHGYDQTDAKLLQEARRIGFPLIIKAAAGGGGRGMKVVEKESDFAELLASAKRESKSAFGSDVVFMERYIRGAKHIEFQIFGDSLGNVVHLFERECSVQRRHQKIIEEATSPALDPALRARMSEVAVRAAQKAEYVGAGTVEFLLDADKNFYFLEMNTRLQVEHPVSELVCGVDLVKAQIMVAQGFPLPWTQSELRARGHAIECRLYAEDAYKNGIPSPGTVGFVQFPEGPGRRYDCGVESGDEVTSFYDPMIAKLIVWDENRRLAIKKMLHVLKESVVLGVKTNIPFLVEILSHPEFQSGTMTIQFLNTYFPQGIEEPKLSAADTEFSERAWKVIGTGATQNGASSSGAGGSRHASPFEGAWRNV